MACAGYPETDSVPVATRCSSRARPCVVSLACGDRVASEGPPEGVVSVPRTVPGEAFVRSPQPR